MNSLLKIGFTIAAISAVIFGYLYFKTSATNASSQPCTLDAPSNFTSVLQNDSLLLNWIM